MRQSHALWPQRNCKSHSVMAFIDIHLHLVPWVPKKAVDKVPLSWDLTSSRGQPEKWLKAMLIDIHTMSTIETMDILGGVQQFYCWRNKEQAYLLGILLSSCPCLPCSSQCPASCTSQNTVKSQQYLMSLTTLCRQGNLPSTLPHPWFRTLRSGYPQAEFSFQCDLARKSTLI